MTEQLVVVVLAVLQLLHGSRRTRTFQKPLQTDLPLILLRRPAEPGQRVDTVRIVRTLRSDRVIV